MKINTLYVWLYINENDINVLSKEKHGISVVRLVILSEYFKSLNFNIELFPLLLLMKSISYNTSLANRYHKLVMSLENELVVYILSRCIYFYEDDKWFQLFFSHLFFDLSLSNLSYYINLIVWRYKLTSGIISIIVLLFTKSFPNITIDLLIETLRIEFILTNKIRIISLKKENANALVWIVCLFFN